MKFYEVVEQVRMLLQREGRVSYRALKREFDLDDTYLEDLKAELIDAKQLAIDEGERCRCGLVFRQFQVPSFKFQVPNPQHLAMVAMN